MTARELNARLTAGGARFFGPTVVVAREKTIEVSRGGIFIPDDARTKQQYGAVVAFGFDSVFRPENVGAMPPMSIGDSIYLPAYGGVIVKQKIGDEVYVLEVLNDKDILMAYKAKGEVELETGGSQSTGGNDG